ARKDGCDCTLHSPLLVWVHLPARSSATAWFGLARPQAAKPRALKLTRRAREAQPVALGDADELSRIGIVRWHVAVHIREERGRALAGRQREHLSAASPVAEPVRGAARYLHQGARGGRALAVADAERDFAAQQVERFIPRVAVGWGAAAFGPCL